MMNKKKILAVVVASAITAPAIAEQSVTEFLERFHADPVTVMNELPEREVDSEAIIPMRELLNEGSTGELELTDEYLAFRDSVRSSIMSASEEGSDHEALPSSAFRSAINNYNDNASRLVDNARTMLTTVHQMDQQNLQVASLDVQPWSDTYWPLYNGSLGDRYADPEKWYQNPNSWQDYFNFAHNTKPVNRYFELGQAHLLSPSEKYDLLVSDQSYTLTKKMWDSGRSYYERNGSVERWMGLCHGWAPAAYMLPRPKQSVTVASANGQQIKFYPSDIKALGTLLWSNASPQVRFIGQRCNIKDPEKDANGRIVNAGCFDTNPGTWHKTVVNQIGVSKRSFIIDATYDYQVWNQPVLSYKYTYFNPETGATSNQASDVLIPRNAYSRDKFKNYRAANATHIVGVQMSVRYMVETSPNHRETDQAGYDYVNRVVYRYDLELNAEGQILGGEWYQNAHPDFLWTPAPGVQANSNYNPNGSWDVRQPLPSNWSQPAVAASNYSQPLTAIVKALFEASSGEVDLPNPNPEPQYPAWKASKSYKPGDRVSYNGTTYEALWYNKNKKPGVTWFWSEVTE
jgi:hypothetical protein